MKRGELAILGILDTSLGLVEWNKRRAMRMLRQKSGVGVETSHRQWLAGETFVDRAPLASSLSPLVPWGLVSEQGRSVGARQIFPWLLALAIAAFPETAALAGPQGLSTADPAPGGEARGDEADKIPAHQRGAELAKDPQGDKDAAPEQGAQLESSGKAAPEQGAGKPATETQAAQEQAAQEQAAKKQAADKQAALEIAQAQAQAAQAARREAQAQLEREREQARIKQAEHEAQLANERAQAIAAREQERLFKLQAEQVKLRSRLEQASLESQTLHDQVIALVQRVDQKLESEMTGALAQEFEQRVSALLARVRQDLERAMQEQRAGESEGVQVHELPTLRVDKAALEAQRLEIIDENEAIAKDTKALTWESISLRYEDMGALNRVRLALLSLIPARRRADLTGLSATGWASVRTELSQMGLELSVRWLRFRERIDRFEQELLKQRQAVAWLTFKLLVLAMIFRWWRKRAPDALYSLRSYLLDRRREFPALEHARVFFWYLIKIRSPLEWWVFGWIIAHLWLPETWLELSLLWVMYKWLVGAYVVRAWLNAFATRGIRRRERLKDQNKALRLQTLGILSFAAMGAGLALELAELLVGPGAIYQWILDGAWILCIPVAIYLLIRWSPVVQARCEERASVSALPRWVSQHRAWGGRMFGTLVGALYLIYQGASRRLGGLLMQVDVFRRASAFLHRRDAEQKTDAVQEPREATRASCASAKAFDPDALNPELLDIGPNKRISKMVAWLDEGRHSLIAVVGERGAGKTSFLARLARDEEQEILNEVIDCPKSGLAELYSRLEAQVGAKIADQDAFAERLEANDNQVICIDNLHRLVKTSIGGLQELDEFIGFARRWNQSVTWIAGFGASAWKYTQRARGERAYFDEVVELRPWKEEEIARFLDDRCQQVGADPDFSFLRLSNAEEDSFGYEHLRDKRALTLEDLQASRSAYYRILWDYSAGNPGIALHAWSQSLFETANPNSPVVRLFEQRMTAQVEQLSLPALFALRSLVQMGQGTKEELVLCTDLSTQDCTGAVRTLLAEGIIERMGPWYRIAWEWCRPVMTVLLRQQLLMK